MPEPLTNTYPVNTTPPTKASGGPPLHEAGRAGLSKTQFAMAFLVAATSDVVSFGTEVVPPVQWTIDVVTALLLFMILGWRWALLPGFVAEAIPGVAAFPVWTLVVAAEAAAVPLMGGHDPPGKRPDAAAVCGSLSAHAL
jgi:hypothetical protein